MAKPPKPPHHQPTAWQANAHLGGGGLMRTGGGILLVPPASNIGWLDLPIGGGGRFTNLDVNADGTIIYTNDTYGCGITTVNDLNTGVGWKFLTTAANMPASHWNFAGTPALNGNITYTLGESGGACWDCVSYAQNSNIIYVVQFGIVYKSVNGITGPFVQCTNPVTVFASANSAAGSSTITVTKPSWWHQWQTSPNINNSNTVIQDLTRPGIPNVEQLNLQGVADASG